MKIAFVGKGGSGKSTTTAFFINYLLSKQQKVLAVDADINMHVSSLLGIERDERLALSEQKNVQKIRQILKNDNSLIKSAAEFVKTTPPGKGSHLISLQSDDEVLKEYATLFAKDSYYMFVGTYESEEIGTACYHTNLSIFENILSHTVLKPQEWLVADMVAGTDAFSNTLHAQFDVIVLVVEPTPEGVSVFEQYIGLAKEAGVDANLLVVGNKLEDETDLEYLKNKIGEKLLGGFVMKKAIKQARQNGTALNMKMLDDSDKVLLEQIASRVMDHGEKPEHKLKLLHSLHKKYVAQDYIVNAHGDITGQIDDSFSYPAN